MDTSSRDLLNFIEYIRNYAESLNLSPEAKEKYIQNEIISWKRIKRNEEERPEQIAKKNLY